MRVENVRRLLPGQPWWSISLLFMEQGERRAFRSSAPAEDPASHSQRLTGSEKQRARSSNRALVVPAPARGKLG